MKDETVGIRVFMVTVFLYLVTVPGLQLLGVPLPWAFAAEILVLSALLWRWRAWFAFRLRLDWMAVVFGFLIFGFWVGLDPYYPHLVESQGEVFSTASIVLKIIIGVLFAPIIEEFFTRYFLHRIVQSKHWLKVRLGVMNTQAFIITTLFFGFAHNRWLAGLIAGALLNYLWYQRKDMNSVVLAHGVANLTLAIFVLVTGRWEFW